MSEGKRSAPDKLPCGRVIAAPKERKSPGEKYAEKLQAYCSRSGLNRSESRDRLLALVVSQVRHFTALDLVRKVQAIHPDIGAATVYRNLPLFVKAGILSEALADENGQALYELEGESHHDHIVCLDCRAILEFHEPQIEKHQERVLKRLKFSAGSHRHVLYAHCELLARK